MCAGAVTAACCALQNSCIGVGPLPTPARAWHRLLPEPLSIEGAEGRGLEVWPTGIKRGLDDRNQNLKPHCLISQPPSKMLSSILGKTNLQFAGMSISLTVSTASLNLRTPDSKQVCGRLTPRPQLPSFIYSSAPHQRC